MNRNFALENNAPSDFIKVEEHQFICHHCHRPFYVAKMPDWMGSDFYKDMCKRKDEQLSLAYKRIRELEEVRR